MLKNFQLGAIIKQGSLTQVLRVPLLQDLQKTLASDWEAQHTSFSEDIQEIPFDAGYQPEEHECFVLSDFVLPDWLTNETSLTAGRLDAINSNDTLVNAIRGIIGFARNVDGKEFILFQNFSRSHVIRPGHFLFLQNDTYETTNRPGLTLENKLSATYDQSEKKLRFRNFRTVNTFLPLADFYEEASEQQIREVLAHGNLAPENVDALATDSNQWFRKRFAMLGASGVLDGYSPKQIQARSKEYDVEVHISKGKIIFPADKQAAKKLLQFLNEELFRGSITETLYETNSKREAD